MKLPEGRQAWLLTISMEVLMGLGLALIWAGVISYHVESQLPEGFVKDSVPVTAISYTISEMSDVSFSLCTVGIVLTFLATAVSFALLDFADELPTYIGIAAGFALTLSAWYLFRLEGSNALAAYQHPEAGQSAESLSKDLWAPLMSHLVLSVISILLFSRNFIKIRLFTSLPSNWYIAAKGLVLAGAAFGQSFFTIMIYANFIVGLVLLVLSPCLAAVGYVGGRVLVYKNEMHAISEEKEFLINKEFS